MEEDLSRRATRLLLCVSRMCFKLWSWCEADGGGIEEVVDARRVNESIENGRLQLAIRRIESCYECWETWMSISRDKKCNILRSWRVLGKKKVNWKPLEIRKPFLISGMVRESKIRVHSRAYVHIHIVRDPQSGEKNELEETAGEIPSIKGNPETYCTNYEFVNHGNLIRIAEYFQAMDRRESSLDTHSREPFHLIETAGSQEARGAKLQSEADCTLPFPSWMSID